VIILSLLSLLYNLTYWYSKVLDFPRLQYLIIALVLLILLPFFTKKRNISLALLGVGLLGAIFIHSIKLYPYVFGEKAVPDISEEAALREERVGVLIANVLITNKAVDEFLGVVEKTDPDILLVMEVNNWWTKQLQVLKKEYPFFMEYPLDNAYGMSLYSKLPLKNQKIIFFNHNDVPSFHALVVLPSGKEFVFHGMHPVAPIPSSKYPDNVGRDEEGLIKVGKLIAQDTLPSMVAGDFNDVSWSNTSRMFGQSGNLKNVRIGRGFYNTFNAQSLIMRWPLDHYFVTKEFALLKLERLPNFNSDHYPMFAEFVLVKS
jgi:endonuclease/exonuclease/phosphatase (EEP) superfamily protein YafD